MVSTNDIFQAAILILGGLSFMAHIHALYTVHRFTRDAPKAPEQDQ